MLKNEKKKKKVEESLELFWNVLNFHGDIDVTKTGTLKPGYKVSSPEWKVPNDERASLKMRAFTVAACMFPLLSSGLGELSASSQPG